HDLQALGVFAELFGGLRDAHRVAVAHRPGVRVVAIPASPHTARRPRDDTHAESVVNECKKPMSPLSSAVCTSVSGNSFERFTRISNGLFASSGLALAAEVL